MDRLDKNEIYEVIRLVRNTANFTNTFFIVAYDRNYLLNAIQEINGYQPYYFLEKIFQIEFTLPPISGEILQKEISKRLDPFLTEKSKVGYRDLLNKEFLFLEEGDADLTHQYIRNIRDVVRFINSFLLSYGFVKDEIYFPDFYNLELIRFKHPDLFSEIYMQHNSFLTTRRDPNRDGENYGNTFALNYIGEQPNGIDMSYLKKYLTSEKETYKLSENDIDLIDNSFASIFPNYKNITNTRKKTANYYLSVTRPSMFDRYFILGVEGKLSEIEFSKMRQLPISDFLMSLNEISKQQDLIDELGERFEEIKDFDNKEDFEKIITGIFFGLILSILNLPKIVILNRSGIMDPR